MAFGVVASAGVAAAPAAPVPTGQVGSWFSHGRTLELRPDGTGTFAAWLGAYDGTLVDVRTVSAVGPAEVVEVTGVRTVGAGAMAPSEAPAGGGLVVVTFGSPVRTAHVEWPTGPRTMASDLCPSQPMTAEQLEALRCGA